MLLSRRNGLITLFVVALLLIPLQWWITGGLLFPRNYAYLLPFIALLGAALVYQRAGAKGLILAMLFALLLQVPAVKGPIAPAPVDDILMHFVELPADTGLLLGCCYDEPVRYEMASRGIEAARYFDLTDKTRVMVAPGLYQVDDLLEWNEVKVKDCDPAPAWGQVIVVECEIEEIGR